MKSKQIIFGILFSVILSFAQTAQIQPNAEQKPEDIIAAIPLTDITGQADLAQAALSDIITQLEPRQDISAIEAGLPAELDSLKRLHSNEIFSHLGEVNTRLLKNMSQEWIFYRTKLDGWQNSLLVYSQELEKAGKQLEEMRNVWELTNKEAISGKAPRAIKDRIRTILSEIKNIDAKLSAKIRELLIHQNSLSQHINKINELISKINAAEKAQHGKLFVKDSPNLWDAATSKDDSLQIVSQFQGSISELLRANLAFINLNKDRFYFHIMVFVMLFALMIYLYSQNKKNRLLSEDDSELKASAYFIARPLSAAILIALMLSVWIYPSSTVTVAEFIFLLLLYPILRLMHGVYSGEIRKAIYILAVLVIMDLLQKNAVGFVVFQRLIHLFASIIFIALAVRLIRPSSAIRQQKLRAWPRLLLKSVPFLIFLMIVSVIANIYGVVSLANAITWGIIESAYILVTVYIAASVVSGLVKVLIRRRRMQAMQFIKTYAHNVERWADYAITTIAFLIWFRSILRITGLFDPIREAYLHLLEYQWMVGSITISVNAVLDFLLILIGTFIFTRVVRVFMDMEIFPRIKLKKGLPAAINMVMRYILIALGILLAFSAIGLDLGKFGLLAGALGVGLGFGLQKIVANFISSLLIAFGQLIRVGDVLEYGGVMGNVTSIGVNSSTVRTFDGSELIIPNADLISNNVTNWTLSDGLRRMQMPVKVAFGSDPHQVLELIKKVAVDHEKVLSTPEPFAVFNGFGDYYLDFTLYYWIPTSLFFEVKTEVALKVYDTIKANGVSAPRPQRDLNLTMNEETPVKTVTKKPAARKATKSR